MIFSLDGIMTARRANRIGQWFVWIIGSDTVELHTDFDVVQSWRIRSTSELGFTTWLHEQNVIGVI